jgi:hypothetical protein
MEFAGTKDVLRRDPADIGNPILYGTHAHITSPKKEQFDGIVYGSFEMCLEPEQTPTCGCDRFSSNGEYQAVAILRAALSGTV